MDLKEALDGLLMCPLSHAKLNCLNNDELANFKKSGAAWANEPLLTGILKTADNAFYYPIIDGIVFLLPRYAIALQKSILGVDELFESALAGEFSGAKQNTFLESDIDETKAAVQSFYDNIGWKAEKGVYQDAKDSEDLRSVCDGYIQHCHQRVKNYLPQTGRYLLDIASGPVQYPVYLSYSENFQYRICADLSLTALTEAKKKLGDKGLYLLCDITQLPIQDNTIDAIVSLHTLYHVPAAQQAKGFSELHRVLKVGGKSVIVYSWGARSILMNVLMFPFKCASLIRRQLLCKKQNLYFHTHTYEWYRDEIKAKYDTQLFCWRSVNVPFLKVFIHRYLGGQCILKFFRYLEENYPHLMGRIGAYPLFVSVKK